MSAIQPNYFPSVDEEKAVREPLIIDDGSLQGRDVSRIPYGNVAITGMVLGAISFLSGYTMAIACGPVGTTCSSTLDTVNTSLVIGGAAVAAISVISTCVLKACHEKGCLN